MPLLIEKNSEKAVVDLPQNPVEQQVEKLLAAVNGLSSLLSLGKQPINTMSDAEKRRRFRNQIAIKWHQKYPNA